MRRLGLLLLIASIAVTNSCKKNKDDEPKNDGDVIITTDGNSLNSRISTSEAGVIFIDPRTQKKSTAADTSSNEYPMEVIATVAAPRNNGDTLRATHVEINGNYAYISYNIEGATYKGGVDVINISNTSSPSLVYSMVFTSMDISAITYYNNRLYIAGAKDISSTPSVTNPAVVGYIPLSNGIPTGSYQTVNYTGYAGTGIVAADGKIFLTTGTTGGLFVVDTNLAQVQNIALTDTRGVAVSSSYVAVQTGNAIYIYNKSNYTLARTITLGTDIADSKRTMEFNGDYLFVANGLGGNKFYNVTTGALLDQIVLPTSIPGVLNSADIVANGVSYNNKLYFAANGAAGAYVCTENTVNHTLNLVGAFNFGIGNSINYIKSRDNVVFIAAGKGGMKIARFTPASIAPSCTGLSAYTGNNTLNVNANQNLQYAGSVSLHTLNVDGTFFYCGTMAISNVCDIKNNASFSMQGTLAFGSSNKTLNVKTNARFKIQGNVTIYGDLNLENNSTLEFVGTNNTITIVGNVTKGTGVTITGTYNDVNHKL